MVEATSSIAGQSDAPKQVSLAVYIGRKNTYAMIYNDEDDRIEVLLHGEEEFRALATND